MGTDLVSACIFCAGWLLGMDLAPRDGLSGQMGFSYATMARRYDVSPVRVDSSDVTPKFVLVDADFLQAPGTGHLNRGHRHTSSNTLMFTIPYHSSRPRGEAALGHPGGAKASWLTGLGTWI